MMLLPKQENGTNIQIGLAWLKRLNASITKGLENMEKKRSNPVAKNLNKFNKPATHKDRKKEQKKGYNKHKNETDTTESGYQ